LMERTARVGQSQVKRKTRNRQQRFVQKFRRKKFKKIIQFTCDFGCDS